MYAFFRPNRGGSHDFYSQIHWWSGVWLLVGLGLSNATQAAETPPAAERMNPDASADRKADLVKCDEETLQGINTVKGEVLRIDGRTLLRPAV